MLKYCLVTACGWPVFSTGLCNKHYHRMRKYGTTDLLPGHYEQGRTPVIQALEESLAKPDLTPLCRKTLTEQLARHEARQCEV